MKNAVIAAALMALATPHAVAQTVAPSIRPLSVAERQNLERDLAAQYAAAKITEARAKEAVAQAEARVRAALAERDRGAAGAEATLEAARAIFAATVDAAGLREASLNMEFEAYKAEVRGVLATASSERQAALRRFADGDRLGAWPVLEALRAAEDRAIAGAASARRAMGWRDDARLRDIMRNRGEATVAQVLELWDKAAALDPGHFRTHIERARLAFELGDLPRAKESAQDAALSARDDDSRRLAMEVSGDIAIAQGDLNYAKRSFGQALDISLRLLASNSFYQREITVYLDRLGDVLVAQGDFDGARAQFLRGLEISKRLAVADPSSAALQRDLAISHNKIGDVLIAHDDLAGALTEFRQSLDIANRLAAADPFSAVLQRDLSVSYNNVGDVLVAKGDLAGARREFQQGLEIRKRLSTADPSSAALQRDLSISYNNVGDVLLAQDDLAGARAQFQQGLNIRERLAAADPSSAAVQRDLTVSYDRIGDVLIAQVDFVGARREFQKSLDIAKRLAAADTSSADLQHDILVSMTKLQRFQDSGVTWSSILIYMEDMERRGVLAPADRTFLERARAEAAQQDP